MKKVRPLGYSAEYLWKIQKHRSVQCTRARANRAEKGRERNKDRKEANLSPKVSPDNGQ